MKKMAARVDQERRSRKRRQVARDVRSQHVRSRQLTQTPDSWIGPFVDSDCASERNLFTDPLLTAQTA